MAVKNRGADMQPEFDRTNSRQTAPQYRPAASAGWVQDELRQRQAVPAEALGMRQTLGDPQVYPNEASAATANTPVKPTREND